MVYRLNYEPTLPATPWGLELPTGDRIYAREVRLAGTLAQTVLADEQGRLRGYLEVTGHATRMGDVITIAPEISTDAQA